MYLDNCCHRLLVWNLYRECGRRRGLVSPLLYPSLLPNSTLTAFRKASGPYYTRAHSTRVRSLRLLSTRSVQWWVDPRVLFSSPGIDSFTAREYWSWLLYKHVCPVSQQTRDIDHSNTRGQLSKELPRRQEARLSIPSKCIEIKGTK